MKVAGFTIIRNALKYDYPVTEAISSILPVCDIFFAGVGNSDDGTRELVDAINPSKLVILDSVWDDRLREGGKLLSVETNKVFDAIPATYDWCFYIQSDECVHEKDIESIRNAMHIHKNNPNVEGLLFNYLHFYGKYDYVGTGRRWYRKEIRIIRNNKNIRSYKDAQGFRMNDGGKLQVKACGADIYHYGWVKPPEKQQAKQNEFHKMWHSDKWVKKNVPDRKEFDYAGIDLLENFKGTHPAVMKERIADARWDFRYDPGLARQNIRRKLLNGVENLTGWRPGENKNYKLV